MSTDMRMIQAMIKQTQMRAGLESIALVSSIGLPIASVGVNMELGVQARTIFSLFDRTAIGLGLGTIEHIAIDGDNKSFVVKPLRKNLTKLHSWFVAIAPTFGGVGVFDITDHEQSVLLKPDGLDEGQELKMDIDETEFLSSVMGLWSGVQLVSGNIALGNILGVFIDGSERRVVVRPKENDWLVAILPKERRTGKVDVELDRAAVTIKGLL